MVGKQYDVGIVITCYNEGYLLESRVAQIQKVMDNTRFTYEIVFVDDGSTDDSILLLDAIVKKNDRMRLVCHEKNMGRGTSVADGIRNVCAKVVGFTDTDLSTPAYYIPVFVAAVNDGMDIVCADRKYKWEITYLHKIFHRVALSVGYKLLARWMLRVPLNDTVSGCKFFNRKRILPILDEVEDPHWFWDTEIMVRSFLHGLKIMEMPAIFIRDAEGGTTVKLARDTFDYLTNLFRFRKEVREIRRQNRIAIEEKGSRI